MKFKTNEKAQIDISEWNMGVDFYKTLDTLKWGHILSFTENNLIESVDILSCEIDWVSTDIGKEDLKKLRISIDNVRQQLFRNLSNNGLRNVKTQILKIRRELWDLEMQHNITRPKNTEDLSDVSMPRINQR